MSYRNMGTIGATAIVSRAPDLSGNFVCDGVADEVEINAAIVFVGAMGGGLVHVGTCPVGVTYYDITASIVNAGHDNIILEGEGDNTVFRLANDTDLDVFLFTSPVGWTLRDFKIDGNKANQTVGNGIHFDVPDYCTVESVTTVDCDEDGIYFLWGGENAFRINWIINNTVEGCDGSGIRPRSNLSARGTIIVSGNTCTGNGVGIQLHSLYAFVVTDNRCVENDHGIKTNTSYEGLIDSNSISFNTFYGLWIDGVANGLAVVGNELHGNGFHGIYFAIAVSVSECLIVGNMLRDNSLGNDNTYDDIYVQGVKHSIVGNFCINRASTFENRHGIHLVDADHCLVSNNACHGHLTDAIRLTTSDYNYVHGNLCENAAGYGLNVVSGTENRIGKNQLLDNTTGPFSDTGTDTILPTKIFQFIQGTAFISADGSAKGWEINAEADMAVALGQLPLEVQQVVRIKIWAVALGAPAGAGGQMHLDILFNAGGSLEAYNLATNSWTLANFDGEEADYVNTNVIHWKIEDGDVGDEISNLLGGDSVELKVNGGTAVAPDGETNATFRVVEVEYV